jgi:cytochrome c551/c552
MMRFVPHRILRHHYDIDLQGAKVKTLRVILMAMMFIPLHTHAKDGRNLAVNQVNGAVSEQRIALVIGNSKYKEKSLSNPANDARDMAVALRELGFDVIDKIDVTQKEMNRAIVQFGEKLNANTIALFYYAGHGMQVKGKNYLIPVDAEIASENSARAETVDVDTVLDQLNRSPLSIVILDACRNNPFERRFRSTGGGLAAMDAPKGTLIAYATAPGSIASDGTGRNGLYTQELLKAMRTNGLPVERMFKEVRRNVTRTSGDTQTPWEMSSLTGEFYFKPGIQVASLESVPIPTGGNFSIDDIKKQQETRGQWDKWQVKMKEDFDQTAAFAGAPELQVAAWERFLSNYAQDNPFSTEDKYLRAQAQGKKQNAQAQQQQATETASHRPAATSSLTYFSSEIEGLFKRNNCFACHAIDKKVVGPAFRDVSIRYRGVPGAEDRLVDKVRNGGSGVWGAMPEVPHRNMSQADLNALVRHILSL